jgi:nucleoid-associated protein YgaU
MIRAVVALFAFALALCLFIVMRPTTHRARAEQAAQGWVSTDLATRAADPAPVPVEPAAPVALRTDESSMQALTQGVLAGLGVTPNAPDGGLRDLTATALAGIRQATGQPDPNASPQTALQSLVVRALRDGQTDAYIDILLNEAARSGTVTVPEALVTTDGRVDTYLLLSSIVSQATIAAGGAAPAVPVVAGGEGVEVRVIQTATTTEQFRFYTVNPGDSLGAIAVKFYGDLVYYPRIFDANRQILSSPDMLKPGQRLVIPDL